MPGTIELRALEHRDLPAARGLLRLACPYDRADAVAGEKIFGPAPGHPATHTTAALNGRDLLGLAVTSGRWIRLLAVAPGARGAGVGTALLAAAESDIVRSGGTRARTCDQPGNYLGPGIDARDTDTLTWFGRRGYHRVGENANLLIPVRGNDRVTRERLRAAMDRVAATGYEVRRAGPVDAAPLADLVGRTYSIAWAFEVERALRSAPEGVHIAETADGDLAGFAVHDGNNRGLGWFGPAGTMPAHRGHGLGAALLLACLLDVADAGHDTCEVAWIGPRDFYERVAGVAGERRFVVMEKDLT